MDYTNLDFLRTANYLNEKFASDEPFAIGKIGNCEMMAIYTYYLSQHKKMPLQWSPTVTHELYYNAGVFPQESNQYVKFIEEMNKAVSNCDALVSWSMFNKDFEARYIAKNNSICQLLDLEGLEPFYSGRPWTQHLKNKTVLVISPFTESIKQQFEIRNLIWDDKRLLDFARLETLKFPLSPGVNNGQSDYNNWNDLLDDYYNKISKIDFDVAIVGTGAASLPLCSHIKSIKKQAIHLGGPTQILFGVKGGRWDSYWFYNEHWIRPLSEETPGALQTGSSNEVENGCYW